jgi:lipopolysaccharide/colanic/teichoic acid biosynthesis glycosyltransferase
VTDIVQYGCAAVSLLLLAPLLLVIGLLIKLTSRGPILYRGLRVGKDGRIFTIYEFSTLRADTEEKSSVQLLPDGDSHYTWMGRLLKRTKLGQLPQLVNVLRGEMTVVGPRPIRPGFLQQLDGDVPSFPVRLNVKPGIMCVDGF